MARGDHTMDASFVALLLATIFVAYSLKLLPVSLGRSALKLAAQPSPTGNCKYDVWIVGAGTLGEEILKQLSIRQPILQIIAENHHEERSLCVAEYGAVHRLREQRTKADEGTARNVIVCLPPSCENYLEEMRYATHLWAGKGEGGSLIYTSSIGVYGSAQRVVTEESAVDTLTPSATR